MNTGHSAEQDREDVTTVRFTGFGASPTSIQAGSGSGIRFQPPRRRLVSIVGGCRVAVPFRASEHHNSYGGGSHQRSDSNSGARLCSLTLLS